MSGPFAAPGRWLRCQLHAHTTNSDGDATPQGLADHYARAGFDVLAITDHWHATSYDHDRLTVIASSELSALVPEQELEEAEVLALGAGTLPDRREHFDTVEACAAWVREQGGVPFLCHPYWSGLGPHHLLDAPSLAGIELYNGGSELANGNGLSDELWDAASHSGRLCPGIATDDCHYPGHDSLLAWTVVRAEDRSREAVLAALDAGRFYGSSGAGIHDVQVGNDAIEVECPPAEAVTLRSGPWDGGRVNADPRRMNWRGEITGRDHHGLITAARFRLPERWPWARVDVLAAGGGRAWTNPQATPLDPAPRGEGGWLAAV
jgi:hypothetical protein